MLRLLNPSGDIIMEAGAGFGRLAALYDGYKRIILLDYSLSLLKEAQKQWGHDQRFIFVAANIYNLPFVDNLLDALVMIRVMHHLQSPETALAELARILQGGKQFILEYANKRNLKAVARYWLRRQDWSPFDVQPYEFVALNYDFHPDWMEEKIGDAGFVVERELAVSHFRIKPVKNRVSASLLAQIDSYVFGPGASIKLSPSVMLSCRKNAKSGECHGYFRCPNCFGVVLDDLGENMVCASCSTCWAIVDGIYDFRAPS
jgi:SAM-dependent methyltransferase